MIARDVLALGPTGWRRLMRDGHPIDPDSLAGWAYRGTSLGLPPLVERLTWKRFQKAFVRDPGAAAVRGWNVRLVQGTDPEAKSEPLRAHGVPRTFGHFAVAPVRDRGVPHGYDRGLLLDYGCGHAPTLDPMSRLRDPIVALRAGDPTLLLGWSYLAVAGRAVGTPSFFLLEREHPVEHVAERVA